MSDEIMKDFKRREHEEQRPKNAGVHADQNLRHHSKTQRRAAKQELSQEAKSFTADEE